MPAILLCIFDVIDRFAFQARFYLDWNELARGENSKCM